VLLVAIWDILDLISLVSVGAMFVNKIITPVS
jgi:hypothetical protein